MRVLILAIALLASSSVYPSFAQEKEKPPVVAPQTAPSQPDHNSQQQERRRTERERSKDGAMDPDQRMRRGDIDRMGREGREIDQHKRMHRYRDDYGDGDKDRGRYGDPAYRDNREFDRADRSYDDAYDDRLPRRVKICIEYENGDEYCRYRQER